jgi:hypothetical protein
MSQTSGRLLLRLPISVDHVHEQPIGPRPVCAALVAPHDPNRLETDHRVASDGGLVVCGGVDDEAMVPSVVEQVVRQGGDRVGCESPTVGGWVNEDVD